jgi:hypothetical protein
VNPAIQKMTGVVVGVILCACSAAGHAHDLLSKPVLRQTFAMTFSQWRHHLQDANEMGSGKVAVSGSYEWTLLTLTAGGILEITPEFLPGQLHRPRKLLLTFEQNRALTEQTRAMSQDQLKKVINDIRLEMKPEFSVLTELDLDKKAARFYFTVYQHGEFPPHDRLAEETQGCWRDCIHLIEQQKRVHP